MNTVDIINQKPYFAMAHAKISFCRVFAYIDKVNTVRTLIRAMLSEVLNLFCFETASATFFGREPLADFHRYSRSCCISCRGSRKSCN